MGEASPLSPHGHGSGYQRVGASSCVTPVLASSGPAPAPRYAEPHPLLPAHLLPSSLGTLQQTHAQPMRERETTNRLAPVSVLFLEIEKIHPPCLRVYAEDRPTYPPLPRRLTYLGYVRPRRSTERATSTWNKKMRKPKLLFHYRHGGSPEKQGKNKKQSMRRETCRHKRDRMIRSGDSMAILIYPGHPTDSKGASGCPGLLLSSFCHQALPVVD